MSIDDVTRKEPIGWPHQHEQLQGLHDQILSQNVPHALLFTGNVSQTLEITRYLAQLFLCTSDIPPCGVCLSCIQFQTLNHPDFFFVDAVTSGRLKTSDVEPLQDWLETKPHHGQKKIYLIHGMDLATPVAANRLLKTLEEPAEHVIAVMTANHSQLVMPTIRSRSFIYALYQSDRAFADVASNIALQQARETENTEFATFFAALLQWTKRWLQAGEQSLLLANQWMLLTKETDQAQCLTILAAYFQDFMHLSVSHVSQLHFPEHVEALQPLSDHLTTDGWIQALTIVLEAKKRLNAHVAVQLNIEQMCIRLREVVLCST